MAIRANSRSPPIELIGLLRRDQVLGRDALPPAVAHQPGVCPDEAPTLARVFLPGLASLSDCWVAIEPYRHFVKAIRNEMLRRVTRFIDHLFLGVRTAAGIDSDEIVSKNTLNRRCVACGDRFRLLPFVFQNVALRFFLIFLPGTTRKAKHTENGKKARQYSFSPMSYLHVIFRLAL